MWVEDLEWIEDDEALDDTLGGVLVLFDEYGSVLTVQDDARSRPPTGNGSGTNVARTDDGPLRDSQASQPGIPLPS